MMDFGHIPVQSGRDIQIFTGDSSAAGVGWQTWTKPQGMKMCQITIIGNGGRGGTGVVGANNTAAGGGGGGSGSVARLTVPVAMLPDVLFLNLRNGLAGAASSYVSIYPNTTVNHALLVAKGGANGGNASGSTAGTAGTAGAITVIGDCPLAGMGVYLFTAGQAGIAGGTTGAAGALTIPVTGIFCTGGTGGAGLGSSGAVGTAGGSFTVPAQPSPYPANPGGAGGSAATTPPGRGSNGNSVAMTSFFYGGTGGGSTHGSATGDGLVQAAGGNGMYGSGGGGMGGALTGSTAAIQSEGGPAWCSIVCW